MGDADDLRESGLNWGGLSNKERWKSRSKKRELEVSDESARSIAQQLVQVKEKIRGLQEEEKKLKENLGKILPITGWLRVEESDCDYVVEHLVSRRKPRLRTKDALRFISSHYGEDAAFLVAENCSEKFRKNTAIYVRPFRSQHNLDSDDQ